jgi:hypothetical protein
MSLSLQIRAYLKQNNIDFEVGEYKTGKPDGQPDQILYWNARLGARPTQAQLDAAWAIQVPIDERAAYASKRAAEYPAIGDQLDALFHAGVFPADMAATIQAVKDKYPKG